MDKPKNSDGRRRVRRHLLLYLNVVDLNTEKAIGRLGDINRSGVLLLLKEPLDIESEIPLAIHIPDTVDGSRSALELLVSVRWCRAAENPGLYEAGCTIIGIDEDDRRYIDSLIERIGFSDGTRRIFLKDERNVFRGIDDPAKDEDDRDERI